MDLAVTVAVLAVFGACTWQVRRGGRGADRLQALARAAVAWVRASPAATLIWLIVCVNSIMLIGLPPSLQTQVLLAHSTNLTQFAQHPVQSLITSALWIEPVDIVFATMVTVLVLGPAERWLGHLGLIAVYFTGSAAASLVAVLSAGRLVAHGWLTDDVDVSGMIDVGVSYGSLCVAGLLVYRIQRLRWRVLAMLTLPVAVQLTLPFFGLYATLGHLRAVLLGYLLWPVTMIPAIRRRATTWTYRPPSAPGGGRGLGCDIT
ncbi:putative protein OS=Tsukamurella paurometabola (strain ATCC 8368 / DSM / CCUG 35730 /CIP 100753 / JCM 10117 / KCTC 9821 / NBRC 16120 / NCIMB 702349/ NCTC 13040) OX=521096 GN=Tpau_1844 PE=4 SV=1 [Tsukamurella paurometabola]|uniref:Uncharacterized protein n=1 Tax=Tsukamurella paurometabola (strain ATCC 8368 / DSM 20162 / CCUG 35730 / CIP 100753 / JCM 10117 / KCTC 9821 / NBRC 16120 / NCIMB 702349 / NCTC 13040) TaxID=521096 RepID=D5UMW3_TSUPD|nr:rhomboid-like protein [Tsukamurella paurometabola]ADG78460.1 hypothetical protein Tpau_1844 [Tsukamurella paurometabola DSM 20162]SUP31729.1 Uncharacterised protein [Tsukamurella paurometabola]